MISVFPPLFIPSILECFICKLNSSAANRKRKGEIGHPWRIPQPTENRGEVPEAKETQLLIPLYRVRIALIKDVPKPNLERASKIKRCSTVSKAL